MFERTFNEATGIIRVRASGSWDETGVEDHMAQMIMLVHRVREKGLPIKVMIDVRAAERQDSDMARAFGALKSVLYGPGDRVAILTDSPDHRDHMRALLAGAEIWAWQSDIAAEQWLLMDGKHARDGTTSI